MEDTKVGRHIGVADTNGCKVADSSTLIFAGIRERSSQGVGNLPTLIFVECQNLKVKESERVRIESVKESVRIGKGQNVQNFDKYGANDACVTIVIQTMA